MEDFERDNWRITHGLSFLPEYGIWGNIKYRSSNPKAKDYERYGGRGIRLSKEWEKFENFIKDMGKRPSKDHSIERKNNNGNYSKENCYWATTKEQSRNKRNSVIFSGENANDASIRLGGNENLIYNRLKRGWSIEDAYSIKRGVMTNYHG